MMGTRDVLSQTAHIVDDAGCPRCCKEVTTAELPVRAARSRS